MMLLPGVLIETLENPAHYTPQQIDLVCRIARVLNRGRLILCEPPTRDA